MRTPREQSFLKYVVGETLDGRASRIKAYTIAVEVFGRSGSFDSQNDPIVRIEASHLRRSLERYYLTAGRSDPIVISIPKGGYVPIFARRQVGVPDPAPPVMPVAPASPSRDRRFFSIAAAAVVLAAMAVAAAWVVSRPTAASAGIPQLLVEPFEGSDRVGSAVIAAGLTQEILGELSKFTDLEVIEAGQSAPLSRETDGIPRYVLNGNVDVSKDAFRLRARVLNRETGEVLWGDNYSGAVDVDGILRAEADIASNVATALAQVYGVIFQAEARRQAENPPDDWTAYACTLAYYSYRAKLDRETHPSVRRCLEETVERFPSYATAWGLLSQTYVDEYRFRYPTETDATLTSIDRALAAARRAVELDPFNVRGLQALMFALYFNNEMDAAMKVGAQAYALNPNDTELMGEYGYRLAMSGRWDQGCPLVEDARARNPGPLPYYEVALALCSYIAGDNRAAVTWLQKTAKPDNPNFHWAAAAIYAEAGLEADAKREAEWLVRNAPELVDKMRHELEVRFGRPADVEKALASLRKAGLDVGE